ETRALIGVGVEVEAAGLSTERLLGCLEELMSVHLERILARPDPLDDLEARIPSAGVDTDQSPAGAERTRERSDDLGRLELNRGTGPVRLRSDDQIEVGADRALLWPYAVEQELMVVSVDHQHDGSLVDRIAGSRAYLRRPVGGEKTLQIGDLPLELARGASRQ